MRLLWVILMERIINYLLSAQSGRSLTRFAVESGCPAERINLNALVERAINAREALAAFKELKNPHWEHVLA